MNRRDRLEADSKKREGGWWRGIRCIRHSWLRLTASPPRRHARVPHRTPDDQRDSSDGTRVLSCDCFPFGRQHGAWTSRDAGLQLLSCRLPGRLLMCACVCLSVPVYRLARLLLRAIFAAAMSLSFSALPAFDRSGAYGYDAVRTLRLDPAQQAVLLRLRQKDPTLTEVDWAARSLNELVALIDAARGTPLRSLALTLYSKDAAAHRIAPQFADMLHSLRFLRELDLRYLALPRSLQLPLLDTLKLHGSTALLESNAAGVASLFAGCRQLRQIWITGSLYGNTTLLDKLLQTLAECLECNDTVEYLSVGEVKASAATWSKLAEALRQHPTITAVHIVSNNLGDEGMLAMQAAVRHNKNIFGIRIAETGLSEIGEQAFMDIQQLFVQNRKPAAQSQHFGMMSVARVAAAAAPRPVERKEDVESRSEAHSLAAASSSTDKTTAVHVLPRRSWRTINPLIS